MISQWMSWENGVDLVASTIPDGPPNVIVHLARTVHTPVGSASSGLVFFQPNSEAAPQVIGFVSENAQVGAYFGPNIFRDTPFEAAPLLPATFEWTFGENEVGAKVSVDGFVIETKLSQLAGLEVVSREMGNTMPFTQQGLEAAAGKFSLTVNGEKVQIYAPCGSMTGGANAGWSPCGLYAR
jgi:hypothetical protein